MKITADNISDIADRISQKYGGRDTLVAIFAPSGDGRVHISIKVEENEVAYGIGDTVSGTLKTTERQAVNT